MQKTLYLLIFTLFTLQINSQNLIGSITIEDLKYEIGVLANDSLQGRKTGSTYGKHSAEFINNCFKKAALIPMGENGLQKFDVITGIEAGRDNFFKIGRKKYKLNRDFVPMSFSNSSLAKSKVVFAGYGFDLEKDKTQWNDFANIDVKGNWVMVFHGSPDIKDFENVFSKYSEDMQKAIVLKDKGAAGILFVDTEAEPNKLKPLRYNQSLANIGIPAFSITKNLANKILSSSNNNIQNIESQIINNKKPFSFNINKKISARAEIIQKKAKGQNVIAKVEGRHPELKHEYIVLGAHYDHLGMGGYGSGSRFPAENAIHNGADDNASGVAALIEIAHDLANSKRGTDRTVIFVAFDGEEIGLLGSKAFVDNPIVPIDKIKAMVNLDMIGRLAKDKNSISVSGTGTATEFDTIISQVSSYYNFKINKSPDGYGPSDHATFYAANIPVLYLTTGAHEDYHAPTDDVEFINFEGLLDITNFTSDIVKILANKSTNLTFKQSGSSQPKMQFANLKVTFGIIPDMVSSSNDGLRVDGVRKDGPADKAGILKGDKIVSINGMAVTNIYDYMERLKDLKKGYNYSVDLIRNGKKEVVIIHF